MLCAKSAATDFLMEFAEVRRDLAEGADAFAKLGIDGDDAFEFIEQFSRKFQIDMHDYRWYFHHGEEGWGLGGLLFKPPYLRVKSIPVTVAVLAKAIETKRWPIEYPEHRLPSVRWDIHINRVLGLAILALVVAGLWSRSSG